MEYKSQALMEQCLKNKLQLLQPQYFNLWQGEVARRTQRACIPLRDSLSGLHLMCCQTQ